jgi:hypothetical protein
MKPVGGYFELALSKGPYAYHEVPYTFKSGRSALHYILRVCKPTMVYVPFYTCNAMLQSFEAADIPFRKYAIDEKLEPVTLPELSNDEYFLYINYFGLKNDAVTRLSAMYGDRLIVDCTQAFFTKGNGISWFFNSCRKFFGVPDGAYLYAPDNMQVEVIESRNEVYAVEHLIKRFNGHIQEGYVAFQENEKLCGPEIKRMSAVSEMLLSQINYDEIIASRRANFDCLHRIFSNQNQFAIIAGEESVPMVYPLIPDYQVDRNMLYDNGIYIPTFWAELRTGTEAGYETERGLAETLLPLPIDHRYNETDIQGMAAVIQFSK